MISIDPGLHHCGVAVWNDGRLFAAWLAQPIGKLKKSADPISCVAPMIRAVATYIDPARRTVVIERPQVYRRSKGDPNDLISLAMVVGGLATLGSSAVSYLPAEHKGQVPKEITEARARALLSPGELANINLPAKSQHNHVWDAVWLGLVHLKRTRS